MKYSPRILFLGSGTDGASHIADANGNLNVLNVERNEDGSWVNSNYANPDNVWNGNERLLLCRNCRCFSLPISREF